MINNSRPCTQRGNKTLVPCFPRTNEVDIESILNQNDIVLRGLDILIHQFYRGELE